jgi:RNA polymerase sigma-70 factor (ECF subfamily)
LPPASTELVSLIASVRDRDRTAFRALYDATAPKLLGLVIRIVRDRAVAEEVLQDAFLRVWQNASTYSPEAGQPMTWLISIARNRAIDLIRRKREVLARDDENGVSWLDSVPDPRDHEGDILGRDALRTCLGRLDGAQRECILLAYCDGYSREELAARFERPVNTIKTWLHRSIGTLRACMDETG